LSSSSSSSLSCDRLLAAEPRWEPASAACAFCAFCALCTFRPVCAKESELSGVSSLLKWSSAAIALDLAIDSFVSSLSTLADTSRASSSARNWCTEKSEESSWLTFISRSPYSNPSPSSSSSSPGDCLLLLLPEEWCFVATFAAPPVWTKESVLSGVSSLPKWSESESAFCRAMSSAVLPSPSVDCLASRPSSSTRNWCTEKSEESLWLTSDSRSPYSYSSLSSGSCLDLAAAFPLRRELLDAEADKSRASKLHERRRSAAILEK